MATPSSDVEAAALKNYGAGKRFTPNTPITPDVASAAEGGGAPPTGPPGGPSPYGAQQQQRRGLLTLADIRRRNLDEQQALRDEGHLRRYRVSNTDSIVAFFIVHHLLVDCLYGIDGFIYLFLSLFIYSNLFIHFFI